MKLAFVAIVVFLAVMPLVGGAGGGVATFAPLVAGSLLLTLGLILTTSRWMGEGALESEEAQERLFVLKVILAGFFVRVLIASFLRMGGLNSVIAPDEGTFHLNGVIFSQWLSGETPYRVGYRFLDSLQVGYFYVVGALYYVFGVEQFVPVLLNCLFGALAAVPVYRITRELAGRPAARSATVLVTFFPSLVLWSTLLIRDCLVILVMLTIFMLVMELRRSFRLRKLLELLLAFMILGSLRQYIFVLVAVSTMLAFLVGGAGRAGRSVLVALGALVGLFVIVRVAGFGMVELERASLHRLNLHRQYNGFERFSGSLLPEVDISEPVSAITYLPVGMVYFLCSPFPWQVLTPRQALALPDVIVWYMLLPPVFMGLARIIRTRFRDAAILIFCITTITMLYSLVEGNVGIIFRHRAQVIAPLMVFAGVGLAMRREKREARFAVAEPEPVARSAA